MNDASGQTIYRREEMPPTIFGAMVLAALAYPEAGAENLRMETALKIAGRQAASTLAPHVTWGPLGETGLPVPVDTRYLRRGETRLEARLMKRLNVGRVAAIGLMKEHDFMWGGRWSRRATVDDLYKKGEISDARNFENHWWQPSRPVLHLSFAWFAMLSIRRRTESEAALRAGFDRLLLDPKYRDDLLRRAEAAESEVSRLGVSPSELIRFR